MSGSMLKIDRFTGGNNFSLWKIKMEALLKSQGIWAPLTADKGGMNVASSEFKAMEEKAHSNIMLCLSDDVIIEVADQKEAAKLWLKLESLYMTKSLTSKLMLKQRLFTLRMLEGTALKDHLDQLNTILLDLRNIGEKVGDEDAALLLLISLPPSYENFVQSFIVNKDDLSLEEVRSALHARELRHKGAGTGTEDHASGLMATGGSKKGKKNKNVCAWCKEKGHWKRDFPKRGQQGQNGSAAVAEQGNSSEDDYVLMADVVTHSQDAWVLDSGASYHICSNRELFSTYNQTDGGSVYMENGAVCKVIGSGSVRLKTNEGKLCTLEQVRHVPLIKKNLISLSLLDSKGYSFKGEGGDLQVCKGSKVVLKGVKSGTLYMLQGSTITGSAGVVSAEIKEADLTKLWHMRLGHMSERGMQELHKKGYLTGHVPKSLGFCEHCVYGKLQRSKFPKAVHRTKGTLDYIHSDCWGPSRVEAIGGYRYFLSIIDDYSRMTWIFVMRHKSEAFARFKEWKTLVENQVGKKVKRLRTDNGLEFCSSEFDGFCKDQGIARHHTVRHTPQQNGVAERMNQTLLAKARCMLSNAGLSRGFWGEAVSMACYLVNRSPHTGIGCKIPMEVWSGRAVDYSDLRVFGCVAYYHVDDGKLEPRAKKGVFMGFRTGVKGYKIWADSKIILRRSVVFDEKNFIEI